MFSLVRTITNYCSYGDYTASCCCHVTGEYCPTPPTQRQWQVLREQKERGQALRSSACRADSGGITSGGGGGGSSSGGSQSVHRHAKVLVTRLQERNAHCLDVEAADSWGGSAHTDIQGTCRRWSFRLSEAFTWTREDKRGTPVLAESYWLWRN